MDDILVNKIDLPEPKKRRSCTLFLIILVIVFLILSVVFIILYVLEKNKNKEEKTSSNDNPLSLWEECNSKTEILDYIENITSEDSKNFIPKADRIAVFDMDGTLFQETDPTYCDLKLYVHRVLNDTNYNATAEQRLYAEKVLNGSLSEEEERYLDQLNAEIYKDMTIEELNDYVKEFLNHEADGYTGMKRGDAFYKPMLELIEYLQENDFIVYVVTGTERFTARSIIENHINIPNSQIIGTETKIVSTHQNSSDPYDYTFQQYDDLIFNGTLITKNLNMNKVLYIVKEIGKVPILSFGNSDSDSSMANFVVSTKNYQRKAFMLLCDDTERENGNVAKAKSMASECEEYGWISISMKNDWKTIYGDNVTKKTFNY